LAQANSESIISIRGLNDRLRLFGHLDANLDALERATHASVHVAGDDIVIVGEKRAVSAATAAVKRLVRAAIAGRELTVEDVGHALAADSREEPVAEIGEPLAVTRKGRPVRPRSAGQRAFVEAVGANTLTFGIGPAGTGKTFLAVVLALEALRAGKVQRIVLSRPAVGRAKNLAFFPAIFRKKWTRISDRFSMRSRRSWSRKPCNAHSSADRSKSRRSRTCADGRSPIHSSCSTKRRTRPTSR
jgi:phosphate starvation-inducible PhoH-like protein